MIEIERRFLCERQVAAGAKKSVDVWQGYLAVSYDGEVRIRGVNGAEYWLSVKRLPNPATVMVRSEFDMPITEEQFTRLKDQIVGLPIVKTRYYVDLDDGLILEVDIFKGEHTGLIIAEVEFKSIVEAEYWLAPTWLGREITGDRRYLNGSLATAWSRSLLL